MDKMKINYITNEIRRPLLLFGGIFSSFSINSNHDYYYNYNDYRNNKNIGNDNNYTDKNKVVNNNNNNNLNMCKISNINNIGIVEEQQQKQQEEETQQLQNDDQQKYNDCNKININHLISNNNDQEGEEYYIDGSARRFHTKEIKH